MLVAVPILHLPSTTELSQLTSTNQSIWREVLPAYTLSRLLERLVPGGFSFFLFRSFFRIYLDGRALCSRFK